MSYLVWLAVGVAFVICEIITVNYFFTLCLAFGSFAAAILAYFHATFLQCVLAFAAVSIISIFFIRPLLKKWMSKSPTVKSNVDELIGAHAIVTQDITPEKAGFVEVNGGTWLAEAASEIKAGEKVVVESISGVKVIVKKQQN